VVEAVVELELEVEIEFPDAVVLELKVEVVVEFTAAEAGNCSRNVTNAVLVPVLLTAMITGSSPVGAASGIGIKLGIPVGTTNPIAFPPVLFLPLARIPMAEELLSTEYRAVLF
jgi:hypothetical protein